MKTWLESFVVHRPVLTRLVARFVRPHEIEDIVQETFVRSYVAASKETIRNPRAFILQTARNLVLDHLKSAQKRLSCSLEDLVDLEAMAQPGSTEGEYEWQEKFVFFCEAVGELPLQCRRIFILKKVYGLTHDEIAGYLEISESTVNKHIVKGMVMVVQRMSARAQSGARSRSARGSYVDEAQGS
ncbi:MAG: RNA polymerase sigma factor [Gammaproteobacteria bacterium]